MQAEDFDLLYRATSGSPAYRKAVREAARGLPDWLVPFSSADAALLERIAAELRVREGDIFLDLCCGAGGSGLWVAERTGASVIGIDFSATAIEAATSLARSRNIADRAKFMVADATATGLPSACVCGVMSIDALMFIDPERVVAEIARVLKPGGILVATAAESIVEPFRPTIVRDYRPFFEWAGFRTIHHEGRDGQTDQLALYRALQERAEELRAEMGTVAEVLLEEARNALTRAAEGTTRVRSVLLVAERTS